jgi:signal transduction histidine kinase
LRGLIPADYANLQWVREQLHFCVILTLNNAYYQVREGETQAFYELFRVELESSNFEELVRRFLETLVNFCRADEGRLYLVDDLSGAWVPRASVGGSEPPVAPNSPSRRKGLAKPRYIAQQSGQDLILDSTWRRRFASCWSVPLAAKGRVAGVVQFGFSRQYEWLPREEELLSAAAERCLLSAEKARLMEDLAAREAQVRQLAEHMLHVEEVERRRISRELHDEAGQSLLCIRLQMEMMERSVLPQQDDLRSKIKELLGQTDHTILEIRRLIAALSPAVLEQLGLGAALRQLIKRFRRRHPCRVRLHLNRLGGLPKKTETIVYRLLQECCNNIAKHSRASTVNISVTCADGRLKLNVEDNGIGFDVNEALSRRDSFGLSGIRERVAVLGGRFDVISRHQGSGIEDKNGVGQRARGMGRTGRSVGAHAAVAEPRVRSKRASRSGTKISIELPIPVEG